MKPQKIHLFNKINITNHIFQTFFIFLTKVHFIMFPVRTIELVIFSDHVFEHIYRIITLTLFYTDTMLDVPVASFNY